MLSKNPSQTAGQNPATRLILIFATCLALSGCTAITVAGAAVGVAATAASTAVDVGVGAAKLTVKAGSKAVDVVTGD